LATPPPAIKARTLSFTLKPPWGFYSVRRSRLLPSFKPAVKRC